MVTFHSSEHTVTVYRRPFVEAGKTNLTCPLLCEDSLSMLLFIDFAQTLEHSQGELKYSQLGYYIGKQVWIHTA